MRLTVTGNSEAAQAHLVARLATRAAADARGAINEALRTARVDLYAKQRAVFDRPTPFTTPGNAESSSGSVRVDFVSAKDPAKQMGAVMIRGKGQTIGVSVPAESYLRAEIRAGQRRAKRMEVLLQRKGILPQGWVTTPGQGARLDSYGNMSRGQIVQILSWVQAFGADSRRANSTEASRKRAKVNVGGMRRAMQYIVVPAPRKGTGLAPGVWQRVDFGGLGSGLRCVLAFVRTARYRPRFDFEGIARASVQRTFPASMARRAAAP